MSQGKQHVSDDKDKVKSSNALKKILVEINKYPEFFPEGVKFEGNIFSIPPRISLYNEALRFAE